MLLIQGVICQLPRDRWMGLWLRPWGESITWPPVDWQFSVVARFVISRIRETGSNLWCCFKETPSTTGWNHDIFYPHYTEISKVVFLPVQTHFIKVYVVWNAHIYSKCASVCCANWIASSVEGIYCMTELFWKQLLNDVWINIILISPSC